MRVGEQEARESTGAEAEAHRGFRDRAAGGDEEIEQGLHAQRIVAVFGTDTLAFGKRQDREEFRRRRIGVDLDGATHVEGDSTAQSGEGVGAIAVLRSIFKCLRGEAGRLMGKAHGAVGLVALLAAGPRGAEGFDAALLEKVGVGLVEVVGRLLVGHSVIIAHRRR